MREPGKPGRPPLSPMVPLTNEEATVAAALPDFDDGGASSIRKNRYIALRVCGFTVDEARGMVGGLSRTTIFNWRKEDPEFARYDTSGLTESRRQASTEFLDTEFRRNFAMALLLDSTVLKKSLTTPDELTTQEHSYIGKMRAYYTPQQLDAMRKVLAGQDVSEPADYNELMLYVRQRVKGGEIKIIPGE